MGFGSFYTSKHMSHGVRRLASGAHIRFRISDRIRKSPKHIRIIDGVNRILQHVSDIKAERSPGLSCSYTNI